MKTSQDLIWQCDAQGRYTYLNPAWETTFGYRTEEMLGRRLSDFLPPDTAERDAREFSRLMQAGTVKGYEAVFIAKSGNKIHLVLNAKYLRDDDGHILGARGTAHDITERKRAEEALRQSNENLSKIIKTTPDASCITRLADGTFLQINQAFTDITGYAPEELLGRSSLPGGVALWTRVEDRERMVTELRTKGEVISLEMALRIRDGTIRTSLLSARVLEINGEKCILTIAHDITERKRMEGALRLSNEKFSKVFAASPDPISITRLSDGKYLEVNQSFTNTTGFTPEEVLGRSSLPGGIALWTSQEDRNRMVAGLATHGEVIRMEAPLRMKNGAIRTALLSARILEINGEECIITVARDITERQQAEEALRAEDARYRAVVESSPDAITQSDLNGTILMCNRQTALLHGYERPEDLIGTSVFGLFPPDELERAKMNLQKTLKEGVIRNAAYRFLRRDGSQFPAELSATVIVNREGKPTSFMAMTRDISERRRIEETLRQSEERFTRLAQATFEGVAIHDNGQDFGCEPGYDRYIRL